MKWATTKLKENCWQFRLPWRCSGTTWGTLPNRACPGLYWKPLDAVIGKCMRCIAPAATMVNKFVETTQHTNKTQLLASNYGTFWWIVVYENFNPKTNPLLSSMMRPSCVKMYISTIGAGELSYIFRCKTLLWSLLNSWVDICAHRGKADK